MLINMQIRVVLGLGLFSLANSQLVVPNGQRLASVNADDDRPQCNGPCVQRLLYQTAYSSAATGLNEAMNAFESHDWCINENAIWCPDVINSTLSGIAGRAVYDATLDLDVHHCGAQCVAQSLMTTTSKAAYSAMLWAKQTVNGTETWDNSTWIRREDKIKDLHDAMWLLEREINEPKQVDGAEVARLMNCVCYEASAAPVCNTNRSPRRDCTCAPLIDNPQQLESTKASSYIVPRSDASIAWTLGSGISKGPVPVTNARTVGTWAPIVSKQHVPISNTSTAWTWPSLVPQLHSSLPASLSLRRSSIRNSQATTTVYGTNTQPSIETVISSAPTTVYRAGTSKLIETGTELATTTKARTSHLVETATEAAITTKAGTSHPVETVTELATTTVYRDNASPTTIISNQSPKPSKHIDHDDDDNDDDDDDDLALALPFLAGAAGALIPLAVTAAPCIIDPILCEATTLLPFLQGVTGVTRRVSGPFSWFGHLFHSATSIASGVTGSIFDSTSSFMSDIRSQSSHENLPQRPQSGAWQPEDPLPPVPPGQRHQGTQTDEREKEDKGTQTPWDDVEEARDKWKKARAEVEETKIERDKTRKALKNAEDRIREAEDEVKKARKEAERARRESDLEKADKAKKEQEHAEQEAKKVREEEVKAKKAKVKAEERQRKANEMEKKTAETQHDAEEKAKAERINPDDVFRGEVYDPVTRQLKQETLIRTYRHISHGMKMAELVRKGMKPYYVLGSDGTPIKSTGYEETEAASDTGFWITWKRAEDLHRMGGDWRKIGKGDKVRYVQYEDGKAALSSQGEPLVRNSLNIMDTVVASNTEKMKKYEEGIKNRVYDTDQTEVLMGGNGDPELSLETDGTVEWAGQKPEAMSKPTPEAGGSTIRTITKTSIRISTVTLHSTQTEHAYKTVTVPQRHTTTVSIGAGHERTETVTKTATRLTTTTAYISKTLWKSVEPIVRTETLLHTTTMYLKATPSTVTRSTTDSKTLWWSVDPIVHTETRLYTTTKYLKATPSTTTRSTTEFTTITSNKVNTEFRTQTVTASPSTHTTTDHRYIMTEIHMPPGAPVPAMNGICCVPDGCRNAAAPTGCHIAC